MCIGSFVVVDQVAIKVCNSDSDWAARSYFEKFDQIVDDTPASNSSNRLFLATFCQLFIQGLVPDLRPNDHLLILDLYLHFETHEEKERH